MVKKTLIKNLLVTSALSLSLVSGLSAADEQKYIIATASTGGTYYPVGVGIATIASIKLAKNIILHFQQ